MSIHIEWLNAKSTSIDVVLAGHDINGEPTDAAEDAITEPFGLVFSGDDAVVIEGTYGELRRLLARALIKLSMANEGST